MVTFARSNIRHNTRAVVGLEPRSESNEAKLTQLLESLSVDASPERQGKAIGEIAKLADEKTIQGIISKSIKARAFNEKLAEAVEKASRTRIFTENGTEIQAYDWIIVAVSGKGQILGFNMNMTTDKDRSQNVHYPVSKTQYTRLFPNDDMLALGVSGLEQFEKYGMKATGDDANIFIGEVPEFLMDGEIVRIAGGSRYPTPDTFKALTGKEREKEFWLAGAMELIFAEEVRFYLLNPGVNPEQVRHVVPAWFEKALNDPDKRPLLD